MCQGPRYTAFSTFETFPFPPGLTPDVLASGYASDGRALTVAEAAEEINRLYEN